MLALIDFDVVYAGGGYGDVGGYGGWGVQVLVIHLLAVAAGRRKEEGEIGVTEDVKIHRGFVMMTLES